MSKKTKTKNKTIIAVICLVAILAICIIAIIVSNQNKNEENTIDINLDGLSNFIEKNINNNDFSQLIFENLNKNNKIEYCIGVLMKNENTSSVLVDDVIKYYIELFDDDSNYYSILDYLLMNNLNNYELDKETDEFTLKEGRKELSNSDINFKIKHIGNKVENNQIVSEFKVYTPKKSTDFLEYFTKKYDEKNVNIEKNHEIISKILEIDNKDEISKEDFDYLFMIMEEDIDNLAKVTNFQVVFEKIDNRFIIKDVKLK